MVQVTQMYHDFFLIPEREEIAGNLTHRTHTVRPGNVVVKGLLIVRQKTLNEIHEVSR